jgi:hypothetical protein
MNSESYILSTLPLRLAPISFIDYTAGERVEYELIMDDRRPGSRSAHRVTGPDGVKVKGELRAPPTR